MIRRRRNRQIERALNAEVALRLKVAGVLFIPVPNGLYIRADNEAERILAARIVKQLKAQGGMVPGAPDFVILGNGKGACVELKRPAAVDVLGRKTPAGIPSDAQIAFRERAIDAGVPYAICSNWNEVRDCLTEWGMIDDSQSC